jgi:hypothetical protein
MDSGTNVRATSPALSDLAFQFSPIQQLAT